MSDINEVKYGANSSAMRSAAAKVFKNIYKDVKTRRNSDYSKIFLAVEQGANAPGKLPLDKAAMEIVPWVEDVTVEIEGDGTAFLFSDSDVLDVAYDVAEQLLDALRKDGLISPKGMRENTAGKPFRDFRKQLDEQSYDLREGAVKAAMEDWIESLPKAVVDEINKKYAAKLKAAELTGLSKGDPVRKALIDLLNKHKVKPALGDKSREMDISALEMMFVTMLGEAFNPGDYGFRIDKDGDKFVVYKLSTSQGSVRFPDGRRGTVINRYKTMEEAIAAVKRNAGVKESVPAKKADDEVEEATDTAPSESDLKIWYKATGAVPPFEGAVPSYKLLKKMFLRDKKQGNKAWKVWQDLVKKGKVSESVEVEEAMVKVALNPNKKIGYQVTDVGPGGKRTVSKSENFPEEEPIVQVREAGHQSLYRYKGKYYIVSYSSLANETAIFAGDASGKPTSYADLWSERGGVHPDAAIKQFLSYKFKKDLQVVVGR
jgi:hypothetical protein